MGFSQEWENTYKGAKQLSIWPWSEVVSLTHKFCDLKGDLKVLELGCGAGANIPYFASFSGTRYYGLEGSDTMVKKLQANFQDNENIKIACADFTKTFYFDELAGQVDIIIDRSSVTHNKTADIKNVVKMAQKFLKSGGKYMAFDWFSLDNEVLKKDKKIQIDDNTFVFEEGYYYGLGNVHFSDDEHIKTLFTDFKTEYLVKKTNTILAPSNEISSSYTFVMSKK